MFVREHSFLMRFFAALALVVWSGTFHHDVWLGLLDIDHHHDHHIVEKQKDAHPHGGHSHSHKSEHDHRDTIPLPEADADLVTSTVAKISVDGPKQTFESYFCLLVGVAHFLTGLTVVETGHPPPDGDLDHNPPALILLAHSVQSNAPPSIA